MGWPCSVVEKFVRREADVDADADQISWIVSSMDLGNVVSPLFAGHLMDRVGRRPCVIALGPLFAAAWLLTLCVPNFWSLCAARLLAGVAKGVSYTVVPVYLGEIAGAGIRGALSSVFCVQLYAGTLLEVVVGPLVSYRVLNAVSAVPAVAFALAVIRAVPESPHYLLKANRSREAGDRLRWFRHGDERADVDAELRETETSVREETENRAAFLETFTAGGCGNLKALATVLVPCVAQRAGGMSCLLVYSTFFLPDPAPVMAKSGYTTLFFASVVLFSFAGTALVDRLGRRPLLVLSEAATGTITLLLAAYYYAAGRVDVSRFAWLPYLCHASFSVAFAAGVSFIPVVLLGELFPVNVRSHCSAVVSVALASCSFVANKTFLLVSRRYGYHAAFVVFTVINYSSAVFSYVYTVETKGKTFAEIQEMLRPDDRDKSAQGLKSLQTEQQGRRDSGEKSTEGKK